jgi:serine phosphatase RsbU (regulator of sigma subunit)
MYSFNRSLRLLWLVIPLQSVAAAALTIVLYGDPAVRAVPHGGFVARLAVEAVVCLLLVVVGYGLFVSFIQGEGARHLRLRTEMSLAARIHDGLVPPVNLRLGRLEIFGRSHAGGEMGGDLLEVVDRDGCVTLFVADVSGHGVSAGVVMGMVKSAARMRLLAGDDLRGLLDDLNRVLCDLTATEIFVTLAAMRFDGLEADWVLAGHPAIVHFRAADDSLQSLAAEHLPLGVLREERFAPHRAAFAAGDLLVIFTDGLPETMNQRDEEFGTARIETLVAQHALRPLHEICDEIMRAVRAFGPQLDDQSLLLVRLLDRTTE